MLSESVYNFAATSRRGTTTGDPDSDSQQYDSSTQTTPTTTTTSTSTTQLQLAASIQQQSAVQGTQTTPQQSKPRNKRKNFKPISSRMAEVSDESDEREDDSESAPGGPNDDESSSLLDYERKSMLLQTGTEERLPGAGVLQMAKQRLNNNEVIPMDLSVATRPPSSDEDSGDSFRHKFILEQLRSQKLYSPHNDVSINNSAVLFSLLYNKAND